MEELIDEQVLPSTLVDTCLEDLADSQNLIDKITSGIVFYDRTLVEWIEYFSLAPPEKDNVNNETLRNCFLDLTKLIQEASFYYSICSNFNQIITSTTQNIKSMQVNKIVDSYAQAKAKRPSALVINRIADHRLSDISTQILASKILKEFWKERKETLIEVRKCLEQIALNHNVELKYNN